MKSANTILTYLDVNLQGPGSANAGIGRRTERDENTDGEKLDALNILHPWSEQYGDYSYS